MLQTQALQHKYSAGQIFNFPDIKCNPSETLLVLGDSGVGKTTLLHILAGILKPTNGKVVINDQSIYDLKGNQIDKFRGQNIGIVFQKPHFVESLNAEENVFLTQKMADNKIDRNAVKALLEDLNIYTRSRAKTFEMSQGEQQRLSIARALINKPQIILADEPTSALDDKNCEEVVRLLEHHANEVQAALIIVTHDNRLKHLFKNHVTLN